MDIQDLFTHHSESILVGLDTKIMFLIQVVTKLWPNFNICKFFPPGQLLGVPMHP